MKICVTVLAAACLASNALAIDDLGMVNINLDGSLAAPGYTPRAVADSYRNYAAPPSTLVAIQGTGLGRLDGDDMTLVNNGVNLLSSIGFSIANGNAAGTAGQFNAMSVTFNIFDGVSFANLGSFNTNLNLVTLFGAGGLPVNSSGRIGFADGALEAFNIFLPNKIIITQTITSVTATGANDINLVGQQVRTPPGVGTSDDSIIFNGSVVADPYGTSFDGNFSYFVRTNSVPTPGAFALIGLGGLVAARRRR